MQFFCKRFYKKSVEFAFCFVIVAILFSSCKKSVFPQSQFDSAYELMIQGDFENATENFRLLSEKYSRYPEIWYNYAFCLMEKKSYKAAEKAFCRAIFYRKNVVMYENPQVIKEDAMTSILEVFLLEGDFENAENQAEKCFSENDTKEMQIAVIATYFRLGFSEKVETIFKNHGIDIQKLIER